MFGSCIGEGLALAGFTLLHSSYVFHKCPKIIPIKINVCCKIFMIQFQIPFPQNHRSTKEMVVTDLSLRLWLLQCPCSHMIKIQSFDSPPFFRVVLISKPQDFTIRTQGMVFPLHKTKVKPLAKGWQQYPIHFYLLRAM